MRTAIKDMMDIFSSNNSLYTKEEKFKFLNDTISRYNITIDELDSFLKDEIRNRRIEKIIE